MVPFIEMKKVKEGVCLVGKKWKFCLDRLGFENLGANQVEI